MVAALAAVPPRGLCGERAPGERWPCDNTGLVYLWENSSAQNEAGQGRMCIPDARDAATFGRYGVMDLVGGSLVAGPESDAELLDACRKSGAFSLEALVQPECVDLSDPTAIISFSADGKCNFALGMVKNKLVMRLRTSQNEPDPPIEFGILKAKTPQHVIVTFEAGKLICYVDGKSRTKDITLKGDLQAWTPAHLAFGDKIWPGTLEGIAIYSRALDANEAATHYKGYVARLEKRQPAHRVVMDAKLFDITPNSTPEAIKPYRRLLLLDNYEVVKVVDGKCDDKKISVARWGILDDKVLKLKREKGKIYRLVLEPWSENEQLESERSLNSTEDLTLPVYYNVDKRP